MTTRPPCDDCGAEPGRWFDEWTKRWIGRRCLAREIGAALGRQKSREYEQFIRALRRPQA